MAPNYNGTILTVLREICIRDGIFNLLVKQLWLLSLEIWLHRKGLFSRISKTVKHQVRETNCTDAKRFDVIFRRETILSIKFRFYLAHGIYKYDVGEQRITRIELLSMFFKKL